MRKCKTQNIKNKGEGTMTNKRIKSLFIAIIIILSAFGNLSTYAAEGISKYFFTFETVENGEEINNFKVKTVTAKLNDAVLTSGIIGNGIFLDGFHANVTINEEPSFYNTEEFTYSFWIKPVFDTYYGDEYIIFENQSMDMYIDTKTKKLHTYLETNNGYVFFEAEDYRFDDNKWVNVVYTYGNGNVKVYANGNCIATDTLSGTILSPGTTYIGGKLRKFRGYMDNIMYRKVYFNEETVKQHYDEVVKYVSNWDHLSYPLKSQYPNGIKAVNNEIFKNRSIDYPMNNNFEDKNEILGLNKYSNQLALTEDKHNGKFALALSQSKDEILPIAETNGFYLIENNTINDYAKPISDANVKIKVQDKTVDIHLDFNMYSEFMATVKSATGATFSSTTGFLETDEDGIYNYTVTVPRNDIYILSIFTTDRGEYHKQFTVGDSLPQSPQNTIVDKTISKMNDVGLWIKPMYRAEEISFYIKAEVFDKDYNREIKYVLIKSDKNADGKFVVGEDLSQGKWQKIELDLFKTDEDINYSLVYGLYMKANTDSKWIIDDVSSEFRDITEKNMDLSKFAEGNVIVSNGALKFEDATDNKTYNSTDKTVKSKIDLNKQLYGLTVNSKPESKNNNQSMESTKENTIVDIPFSSNLWMVDDTEYSSQSQGVSEKINALQKRTVLPASSYYAKTYDIPLEQDIEKRIRFYLFKPYYYSVDISDGSTSQILPRNNAIRTLTKWFDHDVTLKLVTYGYYEGEFKFYAVEYEPVSDTDHKEIMLKNQGETRLKLDGITTEDRVSALLKVQAYSEMSSEDNFLSLSLIDSDNYTYYSTKLTMSLNDDEQEINAILPKIKENSILQIKNMATDTSSESYHEVRLISFKLMNLAEGDWNLEKKYGYLPYTSDTYFTSSNLPANAELKSVTDLYTEENKYAISNLIGKGIYNNSQSNVSYRVYKDSVLKLINLSDEPQYVLIDNARKWIGYGETDILYTSTQEYGTLILPASCRVMILHETRYSSLNALNITVPYYIINGLKDIHQLSDDGNMIYYANYYDDQAIYSYDVSLNEYKKLIDCHAKSLLASSDFSKVLIKDNDNKYILYSLNSNEESKLSGDGRELKYMFTPNNDLMKLTLEKKDSTKYVATLYQFINSEWVMVSENTGTSEQKFSYTGVDFDKDGKQMIVYYESSYNSQNIDLYKEYNNVWSKTKSFGSRTANRISKAYFSPDGNKIYYCVDSKVFSLDVITGTETQILDTCSAIIKVCDDGRLLIKQESGIYCLFDVVSAESQKLFYNRLYSRDNAMTYTSEDNRITYIANNNMLARYTIGENEPKEKYLLSFDGEANWYAFRDGRWILASTNRMPTDAEINANGMTAEQVNKIKPSDFAKVYTGGNDVLTLNVAIYMSTGNNKITPAVESISVKTLEDKSVECLYGSQILSYNKSNYRTVNALFPIENYTKPVEGYYLLAIGNDWLYTYKNGKLVKLLSSASELFTKVENNWLEIKQYGMSAQELRNIPADILNLLLVNENFANSEFAVIYTVKTEDNSTENYKVILRIQGDARYFDDQNLVMEIILSNNDKKIIKSSEMSKEEMEKFMSWLAARQQGKGDIFYKIKTNNRQYFINYFMIASVDVFEEDEYEANAQTPAETNGTNNKSNLISDPLNRIPDNKEQNQLTPQTGTEEWNTGVSPDSIHETEE